MKSRSVRVASSVSRDLTEASRFLVSEREAIPPQDHATPFSSKNLAFPVIIDPADPPIRTERHVTNSITSVRVAIGRAIAQTLPRCPCCQRIKREMDL